MPIAHMDLFPNALFAFSRYLLRGTSPNLPRDKGERLKR